MVRFGITLGLAAITLAAASCIGTRPTVVSQPAVERGKYLVEGLGACGNCHTPKGPTGEIREKHLAGGFEITETFGTAVASNITPDPETGIGRWTDAQIIRAIREGKRPDGRTLGPPMPFEFYRGLSDTDVKAIVAYLRTVPPVRNAVSASRYTMPLPESWGPPLGMVRDVPRTDKVRYGEYLAGPVAHCLDCHTPRLPDGRLDEARFGAGGFPFRGPWGTSYALNLTSDPETGLGNWSDARIIASIFGGRQDGGRVLPPMPTHYYAAGHILREDVDAMIAYLRSLPPIKNKVPAAEPPKR